jgi:hypothetical protein
MSRISYNVEVMQVRVDPASILLRQFEDRTLEVGAALFCCAIQVPMSPRTVARFPSLGHT